jgi:hypothetical protein
MWEVSQITLTYFYCCAGGEKHNRLYSPIRSVTPNLAGKVGVRMCLFPRIPAPKINTLGLHSHEWQGVHPGVATYRIKRFEEKLKVIDRMYSP